MDRGAWWATVHSVAKSWTQLKRLSTGEHICNTIDKGLVFRLHKGHLRINNKKTHPIEEGANDRQAAQKRETLNGQNPH